MEVTLPNGVVLEGLPPNADPEQIKTYAINKGLITEEEYGDFEPVTGAAYDLQRVTDFITDNIDTGSSIAGAIGGAKAGSLAGPMGAVVGGIAGGALGAFGGSLAEQDVKNKDVDVGLAVKEARDSALIDTATFGLGKVIRPLAKAIGVTPDSVLGKLVPSALEDAPVGSLASRRQTQRILAEQGGTLTASQTGQASAVRKVAESISEQGIFSGRAARKRAIENARILEERARGMVDGVDPSLAVNQSELGAGIYGAIKEGRKSSMALYDKGLAEIGEKASGKTASTKRVRNAIDDYLTENTAEGIGSTLNKTTATAVKDIRQLFDAPTLPVNSLLEAQKIVNREIKEAGTFGGPKFNTQTEQQLTVLSNRIKGAIQESIEKVAPDVAADYKTLNRTYGQTMESLLPKINSRVVGAAKEGDYDTLGKLLISSQSPTRINAMMNSIDTAFETMKKSGADMSDLPVKSAVEAKKMVRQSYLADFFGQIVEEGDIYKLANKAKQFSKPTEVARLKAILGDDYVPFKALLNAVAEASGKEGGSVLGLALRSREAGILTGTTTGGEIAGKLGAAASVLGIPEILGRIATNKRSVNQLLALESQYRKNPNLAPEQLASAIAKIVEDLPDSDKKSLQALMQ